MQATDQRGSTKKSFLITYRGPDFTKPFCERHFPDLEINRVNARTVDRTGTKMVFLNHGRQLRTSQWITAVEDYNKQAPAHLKIHWAGATEAEHIRVSEGRRRLCSTTAYKHIMRGGNTYIDWANVSLSGKGPLKNLGSNPSNAFERVPKRTHQTMNENESYKNTGTGDEEVGPRKRSRRPVSYNTDTDDDLETEDCEMEDEEMDDDDFAPEPPRRCDKVSRPVAPEPPRRRDKVNKPVAHEPPRKRVRQPESYDTESDKEDSVPLATNGPPSAPPGLLAYAEALALPRVVRVVALAPGEESDDSIPLAYALDAMGRRIQPHAAPPPAVEPQAAPPPAVEPQAPPPPAVEPQAPPPAVVECLLEPEPQVAPPAAVECLLEPEPQVAPPAAVESQIAELVPRQPGPQIAELQPQVVWRQPGPQIAELQPPLPPNDGGALLQNLQGPSNDGDLVSLASLSAIIQPLLSTVQYLTTSALASKDRTIALLSYQLGIPVPP